MTGDPALPGRPAYLAWLPRFLFETDPVIVRYIGKAWLTALLPSLALSSLVHIVAADASQPTFQLEAAEAALLLVVVGPMIETLLLVVPLVIVDRLFGPGPAAVASALLWGAAHSLLIATWGLVAWWPFLIMSIAFLTWRHEGIGKAIFVAFAIHALQNGLATLIILAADLPVAPSAGP